MFGRKPGSIESRKSRSRPTLGAIEKKSGKGVGQLEELEKDATARGFGLIARKAAKVRD
jgi:hypothetical protein